MDAWRRLFNKNNAKKSFVTKTLDNHTSETQVTGVYTPPPYAPTRYDTMWYNSVHTFRESLIIFKTDNFWQVMTNESK